MLWTRILGNWGWDAYSELGLTAIDVKVDKGYSVGFWSRCPCPWQQTVVFTVCNRKTIDSYNLLNTILCLPTWHKTDKNINHIIYNNRFSKGLTENKQFFFKNPPSIGPLLKGFTWKVFFSWKNTESRGNTATQSQNDFLLTLCFRGNRCRNFHVFLIFSRFGDQKKMS